MLKVISRFVLFFGLTLMAVQGWSQDSLATDKPQMAGLMRSNGKIYVVVAVLIVILTGLFIYVINLDRKISRLEKNSK